MTRQRMVLMLYAGLSFAMLTGCSRDKWRETDVSGVTPPLAFTMMRASDHKLVTANDYRGRIVMLYFGYTFCPDICPTTLANIATILKRLGPDARQVRVLFVTVDPFRDTLPLLASYVKNFAPQIDGLRGAPDELAALARRYRIVYSVTPQTRNHAYEVTHSSAIYIFDGTGAARLLATTLATSSPDISGAAVDLKRLIEDRKPPGLLTRLLRFL